MRRCRCGRRSTSCCRVCIWAPLSSVRRSYRSRRLERDGIVGSRLIVAQARVGLFPAAFARLDTRMGAPRSATWAVTALSMLGPLSGRGAVIPIINMVSICLALSIILCLARAHPAPADRDDCLCVSGAGWPCHHRSRRDRRAGDGGSRTFESILRGPGPHSARVEVAGGMGRTRLGRLPLEAACLDFRMTRAQRRLKNPTRHCRTHR